MSWQFPFSLLNSDLVVVPFTRPFRPALKYVNESRSPANWHVGLTGINSPQEYNAMPCSRREPLETLSTHATIHRAEDQTLT